MNKTFAMVAAVAGVALAIPAFADDTVSAETRVKTKVEREDDGSYVKEKTVVEKSKDATGTVTKAETKVKVEAEADGDAKSTTQTTTVTDPKGLFNKSKTVTTDVVKKEDGQVKHEHKKKVNGKVVEETPAADAKTTGAALPAPTTTTTTTTSGSATTGTTVNGTAAGTSASGSATGSAAY